MLSRFLVWRFPQAYNVLFLTVVASFLCVVAYTSILFVQISVMHIIFANLLFLSMLILFFRVLGIPCLTFKISQVTFFDIVSSLVILVFLIYMFSASTVFGTYYPTFPLLQAELGLGWHPDTAFHVSTIQSIMSFGYPSTSQHGSPVFIAHFLSHYIDAALLLILNINPYESYGLLYVLKVWLFLLLLFGFVVSICKDFPFAMVIGLYALLTLVLTSTWSVVGSHSLWFTSLLLLVFSKIIFEKIIAEEIHNKDIGIILLICIILSLGKISVGFMLTTFVSMFLLLRFPKDIRLYFLGGILAVFFYLFLKGTDSQGSLVEVSFEALTISSFIGYLFHPAKSILHTLYIADALIVLVMILAIYTRLKLVRLFLISMVLSIVVLFCIIKINQSFISAAIYYFEFSYMIVIVLLTFQLFIKYAPIYIRQPNIMAKFMTISTVGIVVLVVGAYYSENPSWLYLKDPNRMLLSSPFNNINQRLSLSNRISFFNLDRNQFSHLFRNHREIKEFKKSLSRFLDIHKLDRTKVSLYIPKEIFQNELAKYGGKPWARGFLVYANVGVPLVYANEELTLGYGFRFYSRDSLQVSAKDFVLRQACEVSQVKAIVKVKRFSSPSFDFLECENGYN